MGIIFGPINSRRFGKSLGVDLSPNRKQCNFDCLYCELEPSKVIDRYLDIIEIDEVLRELKRALEIYKDIDVITITANGEPTLYPYLNELIDEINRIKGDKRVLILSNSSTIYKRAIQDTLLKFDSVKLSLDCATKRCLKRLDRAEKSIDIEDIKRGILEFSKRFKNELVIEILFVKGINDNSLEIDKLNQFLEKLNPTRVDIGSIDRPPAYRVEALDYKSLRDISLKFNSKLPVNIVSRRYDNLTPSYYSKEQILETLKKRPLTRDDIRVLFDKKSEKNLKELLDKNLVYIDKIGNLEFFRFNS
jgi:wyosine [tRNA(Phe)-imidazoG37] synthetase (radical SAM superfamily)